MCPPLNQLIRSIVRIMIRLKMTFLYFQLEVNMIQLDLFKTICGECCIPLPNMDLDSNRPKSVISSTFGSSKLMDRSISSADSSNSYESSNLTPFKTPSPQSIPSPKPGSLLNNKAKKISGPLISRDSTVPEFSDESDDEIQDWSLLNNFAKKGMKDLEPLLNTNDKTQLSAYDQNKLNKARNLRFNALSVKRGCIVNLENLNASTIFINVHDYNDLFMLQPKGKFLETMGFIDNKNVCHFDFEEVIYLVERGSCMAKFYDKSDLSNNERVNEMPPLSLQSIYSILIKSEEQLNQYLVYSILKRDGYIISRNEEFDGSTKLDPVNKLISSTDELYQNIKMSSWTKFLSKFSDFFQIPFPFKFSFSYYNIFTYLHSKILGQSLPKLENNVSSTNIKHYKISFNVWKPSPNFKKKNSPPPDYQISVFKATQRLPKYLELKYLLERSYSNPETHRPKPKPKKQRSSATDHSKKVLETSWDYAKGIDINNLKYDPRRITLAVVDNSTVNFITLSHCSFVSEGPAWRDHWVTWKPPSKKKNAKHKNRHKQRNNNNKIAGEQKESIPFENENQQSSTVAGKDNCNSNSNSNVQPSDPSGETLPKSAPF